MATENQGGFNLEEWEKDPKHETARKNFDAMVASALKRKSDAEAAAKAEEEKKKRESVPFPFNLFTS